MLQAKAVSTSL